MNHSYVLLFCSTANIDSIHTRNSKTGYGENDNIGSVSNNNTHSGRCQAVPWTSQIPTSVHSKRFALRFWHRAAG